MKLSWWKALGGFFLAAALSVPAMGDNTAIPGTLNFIEGQASIQSQPLTPKSVGAAELQPGQTLTTQNGRAEVLLTPGVFLRLDHNSAVKMISPSLTNTEVKLDKGRAEIEVAEIHKQNDLQVTEDDTTTRLMKKGLYDFSANPDLVRVFRGQANVFEGDQTAKVKGGHQLALDATGKLKAQKFNKKEAKGDFYNWSKLRSEYLAEASVNAAQMYNNGSWVGSGWYWDPGLFGYTFLPGSGIIYSPFGWGFYSPYYPADLYYGGPIYRGFGHRDFDNVEHREFVRPHVEMHAGGPFGGFHGAFTGVDHDEGFHGGFAGVDRDDGGFHGGGIHPGGHR